MSTGDILPDHFDVKVLALVQEIKKPENLTFFCRRK